MAAYLEACRQASDNDARLIWVDEQFLLEQKVGPYSEVPLWVPEQFQAFETVDCRRAIAAGLTYRPLAETLRATLEWARLLPRERPGLKLGGASIPPALSRSREAELLAAWRARAAANA